jgi:hypothetical protein
MSKTTATCLLPARCPLLAPLQSPLCHKWKSIAALIFVAILAVPQGLKSSYVGIELAAQLLVYAIAVLIVIRFGLPPLGCAIFVINMMSNVPFSADLSTWYRTTSLLALMSVLLLAGWGFYHSLLGEQPLWKAE